MSSTIDITLKFITGFLLIVWLQLYGTLFEIPYSSNLVELHSIPFWRFFLSILVVISSIWCPLISVLTTLAIFLYLADLEKLTTPFIDLTNSVSSDVSKNEKEEE